MYRYSFPNSTMKRLSRGMASIAVVAGLSACAASPTSLAASRASVGVPFLSGLFLPRPAPMPAARPAPPAPKPHAAPRPASECGAVTPERCLLNKGIIGPHGGGHD